MALVWIEQALFAEVLYTLLFQAFNCSVTYRIIYHLPLCQAHCNISLVLLDFFGFAPMPITWQTLIRLTSMIHIGKASSPFLFCFFPVRHKPSILLNVNTLRECHISGDILNGNKNQTDGEWYMDVYKSTWKHQAGCLQHKCSMCCCSLCIQMTFMQTYHFLSWDTHHMLCLTGSPH